MDSDTETTALYLENCTATITHLRVTGNVAHGHAVVQRTSSVSWTEVEFSDNQVSGLILALDGGSISILHSLFHDNDADAMGGGIAALYIDRPVSAEVSNNLYYGMSGGAVAATIDVRSDEEARITNNVFYGLGGDCDVSLSGTGVDFENNVIAGGGSRLLCLSAEGIGTVQYNDVRHYFNDYGFELDATNLDADPGFVDPDSADFALDPGFSPLVDAGNPLSGYNDADGSRNDIGACGGDHGCWASSTTSDGAFARDRRGPPAGQKPLVHQVEAAALALHQLEVVLSDSAADHAGDRRNSLQGWPVNALVFVMCSLPQR